MNRLTRKIKGCYCIDLITCLPMEYEQINKGNACVEKLGKLEDIEEEFGCPLDAIFKALKDRKLVSINAISSEKPEITLGIYKILGLMFDGENYVLYIYKDNDLTYAYTKDFGKTWMLYDIEVKNE